MRTTTFSYADEEVLITIKPSHGVDALYAPRRTVLDPILVDAARAAGATFDYGTSITGVIRDRTGRVDRRRGPRPPTADAMRHEARWVVGADGLRSVVADAVGAPIERRGTGTTAIVYGYWSGLATDGYRWVFRPDACAGLIPTNDDQTCVFAASTPARDRSRRSCTSCTRSSARPSPASPTGWPRPRRPPESARSAGCPATCACRGDRAGRSSAMPATGRTRSARTG